jgi:hypothetical protein
MHDINSNNVNKYSIDQLIMTSLDWVHFLCAIYLEDIQIPCIVFFLRFICHVIFLISVSLIDFDMSFIMYSSFILIYCVFFISSSFSSAKFGT